MRRAARVDGNHADVVDALEMVGASVQSLATIGSGCPDLLVSRCGLTWVMEVKDGAKPPSARALTPDEARWHEKWQAPVYIVTNIAEALRVIGIPAKRPLPPEILVDALQDRPHVEHGVTRPAKSIKVKTTKETVA